MTRLPPDRNTPAPPVLAGLPWLDFVNTRFRHRNAWVDGLPTPRTLADWLVATGLAPAGGRRALAPLLGGAGGRLLLRQAHSLRAALAELARALADGGPPPERAIRIVNRVLRSAPAHRQLQCEAGVWLERQVPASREPVALLAPIAASAADFLVTGDRSRLRSCGNPRCVLYFYDRTRNAHRRFCSAATCGNRVKAARRYRRLRAAQSG
jgi:predicted RNA-binding Zn ribbon-like protein